MLHAIPGGGIYKLLLMPFYAQLTIPFFMIISGFTYTLSLEKNKHWYALSRIWKKIKRFIFPFLPALIIEIFILGRPDNTVQWLLSGGYSLPGSYYVILMIQLVVLFPLIYEFYKQLHVKKEYSLLTWMVLAMMIQCAYEFLTWLVKLDISIYRLLIFRYFVFLYVGVVLFQEKQEHKECWQEIKKLLPLGFLYILLVGYLNWQPDVIFRYPTWYRSAAPVVFWTGPIAAYLIENDCKIMNWIKINRIYDIVSEKMQLIGKASYHIYIVQMLWFGLVVSHVNTESWRKLIVCAVSIIVCSVAGILYYYVWTCNDKDDCSRINL